MNALEYFSAPGVMTSPGDRAALFDGLPRDIDALCRTLHGLMVHVHWLERYGVELPDERRGELQLRPVAAKLARIMELDPRPLAEARPMHARLASNCRDFSVMLASILQHQGVPARARCGFGRYFTPGHYEDHWVCEYWNADARRWVLVDAQLDELQRDVLAMEFDPADVPRDEFLPGGEAWRLCRAGQADPDKFGIFDMHGLWFVRGNLVRDVASLNKTELLPWDCWGLADTAEASLLASDFALLDDVAELTRGDVPEWERVRELYEGDDGLRVPRVIQSYVDGRIEQVRLPV